MASTTTQAVIAAIARQVSAVIGAQLDGPFVVIRYPPGYNYSVQYGQPPKFNPNTLALIDQLCTTEASGAVGLTGSRFSSKFAAILGSVAYKVSTADQQMTDTLRQQFDQQTTSVIDAFETAFGPITPGEIKSSGCRPATKLGYLLYVMKTDYDDDPANIPTAYASFASVYMQWQSLGARLENLSAQQLKAQDRVAACIANTTGPDAANGGVLTAPDTWGVAYAGLPDNNTITASLTSDSRTVTVNLELQPETAKTMQLKLGDRLMGTLALSDLRIAVASHGMTKTQPIDDLWRKATRIEMQIIYSGLTMLRADPVGISADLATGWYARGILSDIVAKTGKDVTGLQLQGSTFSVGALFGEGKSFARVRTFVISREPDVTIKFYGVSDPGLEAEFPTAEPATIDLGDTLSFGQTTNAFNVLEVTHEDDVTIVHFGPPKPIGTTPNVDQTAHIIGGVVEYPPETA